ncbi:MAG: IS5 family transposase [Acidobacteria bacterium]|nr:IS5 family transposase [Acidobacteriota bacterium]
MRGDDRQQEEMFSYVPLEHRIPLDHPLRAMRKMVDEILVELSPHFERLYSSTGRPSIPPEKLLRALLLQVLYTVRSERLLMEQLDYNLLFRWFVGLTQSDAVWAPTVFTKNRERLLSGDIDRLFFERVIELARTKQLLSDEHFTVDGTLIEAWAGHKSFKPKDAAPTKPPDDPGNPDVDFSGKKRSNETHASTTDPDARLYRKSFGTESKLCYTGHVLMDNRHGLAVDTRLTKATGRAEPEATLEMVCSTPVKTRTTLGADKAYDVRSFAEALRHLYIVPHTARKNASYSTIKISTTRQVGYQLSQRKRKRVEEIFGWLKTVGMMRKTRHRGERRVGWMFTFAVATYNLVRLRNLQQAVAT